MATGATIRTSPLAGRGPVRRPDPVFLALLEVECVSQAVDMARTRAERGHASTWTEYLATLETSLAALLDAAR